MSITGYGRLGFVGWDKKCRTLFNLHRSLAKNTYNTTSQVVWGDWFWPAIGAVVVPDAGGMLSFRHNVSKSKLVGETVTCYYNFTDQIPHGETVTSATCTATVFSGSDSEPEDLILGAAVTEGFYISQKITLGLPGVIYNITCEVSTAEGHTYQVTTLVAVLPDEGSFGQGMGLAIVGNLPDTYAWVEYYELLDIIGGYPPYGPVTVYSGSYPVGWTPTVVDRNIVTSGIAGDTGTFTFVYKLVDFAGNIAYSQQTVYIPPVDLYGTIPDTGYVGIPYSGHYDAQYGMPPYAFDTSSGAVPPGLALSTTDADTCEYAGTPTTAGVYPIVTRVTDDLSETDTEPATITILEPKFILCGGGGGLAYCYDDLVWTTTSVSSVGFWGITYGNGLYVAVGRHDTTNASVIYTSPDFVTWTSRTTPFSVNCRLTFVYWSGDKFITGGAFGGLTDGQAAYSTDGITWNLLTLPGSHGPIECGIYSADLGVYLMGTSNSYGDILRSTDGISWTRYSIGVAIDGLVWNPDSAEFLSVGAQTGSGGETWTSPDGINWTHRSTQGGVSYGFLDVIWDGSKYYASAVGDPTVRGVWESSDHGDIWTQNPDGTNNFGYCIAYIAGTYIVGNAAGNIMVSTDGIDFANANCGISGSVECIHAYYGL